MFQRVIACTMASWCKSNKEGPKLQRLLRKKTKRAVGKAGESKKHNLAGPSQDLDFDPESNGDMSNILPALPSLRKQSPSLR